MEIVFRYEANGQILWLSHAKVFLTVWILICISTAILRANKIRKCPDVESWIEARDIGFVNVVLHWQFSGFCIYINAHKYKYWIYDTSWKN